MSDAESRIEWKSMSLGDFVTFQRGFDLPEKERKPGKVPVMSSSGIFFYHEKVAIKGPGVVTGRCGTIGEVFFIKEDFWPLNTTLFVKDFHGNDPLFTLYFLKTVDFLSCSDKSSVPGVNRNDLHRLPVFVPPLPIQHRIAHILGSLDDKIELNRQMNETLEAMARAIFKSWFVDFDPVRAKAEGRHPAGMDAETAALFPDGFEEVEGKEVPRGWRVKPLDEVADFRNGLALQKYPAKTDDQYLPVIKISQLHAGNTIGSDKADINIPPEYIIEDGDILFSWSGSLAVTVWCGGKGALNQHLFKVSSELFPKWFYYQWVLQYLPDFRLIAEGKATTMGHIQRHHLSETMALVPPPKQIEVMDKMIAPLFDKIISNNIESRIIAEIRDSLLPKLMSGKIHI